MAKVTEKGEVFTIDEMLGEGYQKALNKIIDLCEHIKTMNDTRFIIATIEHAVDVLKETK